MDGIIVNILAALWLGVLTAISPCPLASNIAAVSYISKKITHPVFVFISGFAYTLGRMTSYAILSWMVIGAFLSVPQVAQFLQKYMGHALGPLLVITGLILLEVIQVRLPGVSISDKRQNKLVESGAPGAFLLGIVFALAFCPVSAALFFGSLIPLALNSKFGTLFPFVYGLGTGLPVFIFAVAIALGVTSFNRWLQRITRFEDYTRKITGGIFIIVGLYYAGIYILKIF